MLNLEERFFLLTPICENLKFIKDLDECFEKKEMKKFKCNESNSEKVVKYINKQFNPIILYFERGTKYIYSRFKLPRFAYEINNLSTKKF